MVYCFPPVLKRFDLLSVHTRVSFRSEMTTRFRVSSGCQIRHIRSHSTNQYHWSDKRRPVFVAGLKQCERLERAEKQRVRDSGWSEEGAVLWGASACVCYIFFLLDINDWKEGLKSPSKRLKRPFDWLANVIPLIYGKQWALEKKSFPYENLKPWERSKNHESRF